MFHALICPSNLSLPYALLTSPPPHIPQSIHDLVPCALVRIVRVSPGVRVVVSCPCGLARHPHGLAPAPTLIRILSGSPATGATSAWRQRVRRSSPREQPPPACESNLSAPINPARSSQALLSKASPHGALALPPQGHGWGAQRGELARGERAQIRQKAGEGRRRLAGLWRGKVWRRPRRKAWERRLKQQKPWVRDARRYLHSGDSTGSSTLSAALAYENLTRVNMNPFDKLHPRQGRREVLLGCRGAPCPTMKQCEGLGEQWGASQVHACYDPGVGEETAHAVEAPVNCPRIRARGEQVRFDPACSHAVDDAAVWPWASQVFELENVWVNARGQAFNQHLYFDRGGCGSDHQVRPCCAGEGMAWGARAGGSEGARTRGRALIGWLVLLWVALLWCFPSNAVTLLAWGPSGNGHPRARNVFVHAAGTVVEEYEAVVNLAHWNTWQFYHGLVELLPLFLALRALHPHIQGVPVALQLLQVEFMEAVGSFVLGLDSIDLNARVIPNHQLFFARRLYQVRLYQVRLYQVRLYQVRLYQVCLYQVRLYQVRLYQVRPYQVRPTSRVRQRVSLTSHAFRLLPLAPHTLYRPSHACSALWPLTPPPSPLITASITCCAPALTSCCHHPPDLACSLSPPPPQPLYTWCGHPSPSLWHRLRHNHLLPPNGLPMMRPDWSLVRRPASTLTQPAVSYPLSPPGDWVVVVARRMGTRSLEGFEELVQGVRGVVEGARGAQDGSAVGRVVVFDGSLDISAAYLPFLARSMLYRERPHVTDADPSPTPSLAIISFPHALFTSSPLSAYIGSPCASPLTLSPTPLGATAHRLFRRALLLIGVHGAALTNLIFMPRNATLLELRPRGMANACYHHLSSVCSVHYYLLLCDGGKDTPVTCHMDHLMAALEEAWRAVEETFGL
ncbi:unnamed protein product [Closterium sp. NIES-64]|nr:unnamed protein product [Closterium sp. NIES-64]